MLNAFRHQRTNHDRLAVVSEYRSSAQRLSASTNEPLGLPRQARRRLHECSTPFGINERTTWQATCRKPSAACAQRLSASTNEPRRRLHHARLIRRCAQRLSASTNEPRTVAAADRRLRLCSTPFGINERTTCIALSNDRSPLDVLNAFRHQRTNHTIGVDCAMMASECSTPFGINERTTLGSPCSSPYCAVLNAFRHQRTNHRRSLNPAP